MPTCPDTCPIVQAQILMEQEASRSAAKQQIKDTVTKQTQPITESRLQGPSIRANAESFRSKSGVQTQQMNNNITQQNLSSPSRSPDKRYQSHHIQSDVENRSARSPGAASSKRQPKDDQLDESSYRNFQERSGAASDTAARAAYHEDEQLDETSYKDVSGRSKAAAGTASRGKRRDDEQPDVSSYRNVQGRSRTATSTGPHAKQREDINAEKYSDREFQGKSRASSKGETEEEAGPSSGGSSIPQRHSPCGPECPLKRYKELLKRRTEEKQRKLDRYLIGKGFNYFDNLCTCSVMCLFNQLSRDHFVRSLIQSALLFTVGLKLCSELYAWQIPSRAMFY